MQVIAEFSYDFKGKTHTIFFGCPDSDEEIQAMFDLRYRVYLSQGYIDPEKFSSDKDENDDDDRSIHFIAKTEDHVVGAARLTVTNPLPTEEVFSFEREGVLKNVGNDKKGEVGRMVSMRFKERLEKGLEHIPRHTILLFLVYIAVLEAEKRGIQNGFSCPKKSLIKKLRFLRAPIVQIKDFEEHYPEDGMLYPDYQQKDNPPQPIFFETKKFREYFDRILNNNFLFKKENNGTYFFQDNLSTKVLHKLGIF